MHDWASFGLAIVAILIATASYIRPRQEQHRGNYTPRTAEMPPGSPPPPKPRKR